MSTLGKQHVQTAPEIPVLEGVFEFRHAIGFQPSSPAGETRATSRRTRLATDSTIFREKTCWTSSKWKDYSIKMGGSRFCSPRVADLPHVREPSDRQPFDKVSQAFDELEST